VDKYPEPLGPSVRSAPPATPGPDRALVRYAAAVGITVFAVLSQYFVPERWAATRVVYYNLPGDFLLVYGIPIVAFALLVGLGPLRQWRSRMGVAAGQGLAWYGTLSLLALLIVLLLVIVYEVLDPAALALLQRPNPAVQQAQGDPWLFVGLSFVIGAVEETIFRGWIFGFWNHRPTPWVVPAAWTSALFAAVHLYYGTTYGLASPLIFPSLFLVGFAFAATYRYSGGNLAVPALLHGEMDASAYLTLISKEIALAIHYGVVCVGAAVALVAYLRSGPGSPAPTDATAPGPP